MELFDPHIRSDARPDQDLDNLVYFDVRGGLITAHAPRPFVRAEDLITYWEWLLGPERERLARHGLRARVALGMPPRASPERASPGIWRALDGLLAREGAAAVGELSARSEEAGDWARLTRQLELAGRHELPVVIVPPRQLRVTMTYKMMERVREVEVEPGRAIFSGLDVRQAEIALAEGFGAALRVGPLGVPPRQIASHVEALLEAEPEAARARLMLTAGVRAGAADVLGLPGALQALRKHGIAEEDCRAACGGSARRLLGGPPSS